MGKKAPWSEWERLLYAEKDLSERRGEALARVWLVIESQVADAGLANALRMAVLGDTVPDVVVYQSDEEEVEYEVKEVTADDE